MGKKKCNHTSREKFSELDELSEIGDFNRRVSLGKRSIENVKIEEVQEIV